MAEARENRKLVIVSGLSGAGKSHVLNTLEDQGFYCIDNLPVALLENLSGLLTSEGGKFPDKVGIGIDARSPGSDLRELPGIIEKLKTEGIPTELIFLQADKNILTSRFSETRRKHPLSSEIVSLADALDRERELLEPLSILSDLRLDTSDTSVHELRDIVRARVANRASGSLSLQFLSFGYKHGIPTDADYVFDVRSLPNPHWEKQLRPFTGKDRCVIEFLERQPAVAAMLWDIRAFLEKWLPLFEAENRSYLCVATGCTGGHHRSVYISEQLAAYFSGTGKQVVIRHRDL
ncbi:MAG TPA: RNase adapter RapZ [Gammaproteobacteria bacterium]|nr:RNase adapter RapZ [Gammaproteobacteria bacterium]